MNEAQQQEMFRKYIDERKDFINIIIINNTKAGFIEGRNLNNNIYEQGNICLTPQFQGQGFGSFILKNIIDEHKNQNITLRVFKSNPAQNLYLRLGFEIESETNTHYNMIKRK